VAKAWTVQLLEAEEAVSTAIARASSLREDKPENGWIAEGRDFLAQPHLRAVTWPFWAAFGTLGAGMSRDGGPQLRSDVARRAGATDWSSTFVHLNGGKRDDGAA
jgi:hypothetical protein